MLSGISPARWTPAAFYQEIFETRWFEYIDSCFLMWATPAACAELIQHDMSVSTGRQTGRWQYRDALAWTTTLCFEISQLVIRFHTMSSGWLIEAAGGESTTLS
jgi:hypothetical protein